MLLTPSSPIAVSTQPVVIAFVRSEKGIKILANYRGMQSSLEYAEAFQLKKCVD